GHGQTVDPFVSRADCDLADLPLTGLPKDPVAFFVDGDFDLVSDREERSVRLLVGPIPVRPRLTHDGRSRNLVWNVELLVGQTPEERILDSSAFVDVPAGSDVDPQDLARMDVLGPEDGRHTLDRGVSEAATGKRFGVEI